MHEGAPSALNDKREDNYSDRESVLYDEEYIMACIHNKGFHWHTNQVSSKRSILLPQEKCIKFKKYCMNGLGVRQHYVVHSELQIIKDGIY